MKLSLARLSTPVGVMLVATDDAGCLRVLDWEDYVERMHELLARQYSPGGVTLVDGPIASAVADKLAAYFAGDIAAIDSIPTATGGTEFQRLVWSALREIPAGTTWSYRQLAEHIGRPDAVRAVGTANGANPISLVVPCHRVIGAGGGLTGYAGGLERKRWLLDHERLLEHSA